MKYVKKVAETELWGSGKVALWKDKTILENLYVHRGLSSIKIARMVGCDPTTVRNWLRKFDIPIRSVSKVNWNALGCDGLLGKYIASGRSQVVLAESLNTDPQTVAYHLKKCKIATRGRGEAQHALRGHRVHLTEEALEFIEGELLGDGSIVPISNFSASYEHGTQHRKYLVWNKQRLEEFNMLVKDPYRRTIKGKTYWQFRTLAYSELLDLRKKWYPDGKKRVPRNFCLTPISARQWYLGDGSLTYPSGNKMWRPHITICAAGFDRESIRALMESLKRHGIEVALWSKGQIGMRAHAAQEFLKWIGPCPKEIADIYGYKWPAR